MPTISDFVSVDDQIQFGKPVFKGSRVPVNSLFWHLEEGLTLDSFLNDFPTVTREQAEAAIAWTAKRFELPEILNDETFVG